MSCGTPANLASAEFFALRCAMKIGDAEWARPNASTFCATAQSGRRRSAFWESIMPLRQCFALFHHPAIAILPTTINK